MISLLNSLDTQDTTVDITVLIKRLARAIMLSQGEFSLLLACCNSIAKQQQILNLLPEFSSVEIKEIIIPPSSETLYTILTETLGSIKPEAVMVRGIESVVDINQLLISTNMMRDEFPKQFQFPLVLWINDEVLRKLIWLAPDLKNWASCTIRFDDTAI
jgi:hypothetical protein